MTSDNRDCRNAAKGVGKTFKRHETCFSFYVES